MYCRYCGKEIEDNAAVCAHCQREQFERSPMRDGSPDNGLPDDDHELRVVEPEPREEKVWKNPAPRRERRLPSFRRVVTNLVVALLAVIGLIGVFMPFYNFPAVMSPGEISLPELVQDGMAFVRGVDSAGQTNIFESFRQLASLYAHKTFLWYLGGVFMALVPAFLGLILAGILLKSLSMKYHRYQGLRCMIIYSMIGWGLFYLAGRSMGVWLDFFGNVGPGYWQIFISLAVIQLVRVLDYPEE